MSGGNNTTAKILTNHDGIRNRKFFKKCIVYLTVYVFDFWVENSETEANRGFSLCF
jgi:hypothetical protein